MYQLQLTLHKGYRILDPLNTADFTDDYPGEFEEAFSLGGGYGVPLPENEVDIGYSGDSTYMGQGIRLKSGD